MNIAFALDSSRSMTTTDAQEESYFAHKLYAQVSALAGGADNFVPSALITFSDYPHSKWKFKDCGNTACVEKRFQNLWVTPGGKIN